MCIGGSPAESLNRYALPVAERAPASHVGARFELVSLGTKSLRLMSQSTPVSGSIPVPRLLEPQFLYRAVPG